MQLPVLPSSAARRASTRRERGHFLWESVSCAHGACPPQTKLAHLVGGRGGHVRSAGRKRACEHVQAVKKRAVKDEAHASRSSSESHATLGGSSLARVQSYAVVSQCMRGQWDSVWLEIIMRCAVRVSV